MESSSPVFAVRRGELELVAPAEPTRASFKPLSDVDDQEGLRFYSSGIHVYRSSNGAKDGEDPATVIRDALAKALVFYYTLAGRLREGAGRKLAVECSAEGAVFAEADADVRLDDLEGALCPPFPCHEELLCAARSGYIVDCPLLVYSVVTRLKCGGFIFGLRINHTIADAPGVMQFLKALGELARGAAAPSVRPVWARDLLTARSPPCITHDHPEYEFSTEEIAKDKLTSVLPKDMVRRPIFFGPKEISALRNHLPAHLRMSSSRFELITAAIWRSRTAALAYGPEDEVRVQFIVNARAGSGRSAPLPPGFYGNAFAFRWRRLQRQSCASSLLGYALELVKKAKAKATDEFMQSAVDYLVSNGRPHFAVAKTYIVSDVTRAGFEDVDFGLGEGVYGGPAKGGEGEILGVANYITRARTARGRRAYLWPCACLLMLWRGSRWRLILSLTNQFLIPMYE
ncbi:Benzyl alcohol O-benzoyltransferase [Ananas comosus]|uniref:Benzyl alcohol O-benzoyltransferase n=1 Tax=Ananas comosus TaxID=4615 RepID=A0A199V491_ANACO|nr:Benzyl alcohol O-benzoyltransferase [Ananas comosus]